MDKWGHNLLNQVAMQQAGYEHANVQGGSGEGERKREKKRVAVVSGLYIMGGWGRVWLESSGL